MTPQEFHFGFAVVLVLAFMYFWQKSLETARSEGYDRGKRDGQLLLPAPVRIVEAPREISEGREVIYVYREVKSLGSGDFTKAGE